MTYKFAVLPVLVAALVAAPLSSAHADGWGHRGGGYHGGYHRGGGGGLFLGLAAVTGAAVALATLPFTVVGDAVSAPPPAPVYAQPVYAQQPVYAPAPAYGYYQPRRVVYAYPQPYGYQPGYAYYPQ